MLQNPGGKASYHALRQLFRQPQGPSGAGLLASAPLDYLRSQGRELDADVVVSNNFAFGGINTSLVLKRCA